MKAIALILLFAAIVCVVNSLSTDSNPPIQFDIYGGQIDDNTGRGAIGQ